MQPAAARLNHIHIRIGGAAGDETTIVKINGTSEWQDTVQNNVPERMTYIGFNVIYFSS